MRHAWSAPTLLLVVAGLLGVSGNALAVCVQGGAVFFDRSSTCVGVGRESGCETARIYLFNRWKYGSHSFLLVSTFTSVNIYDVTNPAAPVAKVIPNPYVPWNKTPPATDWDELQWDAAMIDDSPYGIAMFDHYGWVAFEVQNPSSPTGFQFRSRYQVSSQDSSEEPKYARLFRGADGQVYAVGSYLDKRTPNVAVANFSDPTNLVTVAPSVPGVTPSDQLDTAPIGGTWYLFASLHPGLGIYDMSVPSSPTLVKTLTPAGGVKDFYVDRQTSRLYVLTASGTPQSILAYDVSTPASAAVLATIPLADIGTHTFQTVAASDDLLVTSQYDISSYTPPYMQAFTMKIPGHPEEIAANELNLQTNPDEFTADLEAFTATNGDHVIYQAGFSVGTAIAIAKSCTDIAPKPAMTITGGSPGATCPAAATTPSTGVAAEGFPGAGFTVTNQTTGEFTSETVKVDYIGASGRVPVVTATPITTTFTWTSEQTRQPGEYQITLTAYDADGTPYSVTQSVWLCGDPTAALAVTAVNGAACTSCSFIKGDTLTLTASSTGYPTSYTFIKIPPTLPPSVEDTVNPTSQLTLTEAGGYNARAVVHYGYTAPDDASCADPSWARYLGAGHDVCVALGPLAVTVGQAAFEVWQAGIQVATAASPGYVEVDQDVTLRFVGRISPGYAPTFVWSIAGATPGNCNYLAPPFTNATCSIPAGTLIPATAQPWGLAVEICQGGVAGAGCATPAETDQAPSVTVTPSRDTFSFDVSPGSVAVGDEVTITLTTLSGGFSQFSFALGGLTCGGDSHALIFCGDGCQAGTSSVKFRYGSTESGSIKTITGVGLAHGIPIPAPASAQVAVECAGSCPVTSGDVNGDGVVDIGDVFYMINYLFAGGPPPVLSSPQH